VIKVISFDLDGTLVDQTNFDTFFWFEEIPRLYSEKYNISLTHAKKKVYGEYNKVGKDNLEWYQPVYWFNHFKLEHSHERIINDLQKNVKLYPDTLPTLKALHKKYKLIILTNSTKHFVKVKLEVEGLKTYFDAVFSAIDDFKIVKGDSNVYKKLLAKCNVKSDEIIHLGDDWDFDHKVPQKLGIRAFYLDRQKEKDKNEGIVWNLKEFVEQIRRIEKNG
jgi:2-haloalkanoic acid dehalogenase type II